MTHNSKKTHAELVTYAGKLERLLDQAAPVLAKAQERIVELEAKLRELEPLIDMVSTRFDDMNLLMEDPDLDLLDADTQKAIDTMFNPTTK